MPQHYFTRRTLVFFACILILLCAFTAFDTWRQHTLPGSQQMLEAPAGIAVSKQEQTAPTQAESPDSNKRHLALMGQRLCIYAGPVGGGGAMLQQLDIPLKNIPARWLMQLTNGGIEFANEEALFMALDNIDELMEENSEVIGLPEL